MEVLTKCALSDLALARKRGGCLVAQTKRGTLHLVYDGGVYTLTLLGVNPEVLAAGRRAAVLPILVQQYFVVNV